MHSSLRNYAKLVYPTTKWMGTIVHEYISQDASVQHWATTDFFIDQQEYDALKQGGYNLKSPATLSSQQLPDSLRRKIEAWQAVKHQYCDEIKVSDSEQIAPYFIGSFHAKEPSYITQDNKLILLTGDALTGLAFMRSLNNGLHNSTYIGNQVARLDTCSLNE